MPVKFSMPVKYSMPVKSTVFVAYMYIYTVVYVLLDGALYINTVLPKRNVALAQLCAAK